MKGGVDQAKRLPRCRSSRCQRGGMMRGDVEPSQQVFHFNCGHLAKLATPHDVPGLSSSQTLTAANYRLRSARSMMCGSPELALDAVAALALINDCASERPRHPAFRSALALMHHPNGSTLDGTHAVADQPNCCSLTSFSPCWSCSRSQIVDCGTAGEDRCWVVPSWMASAT